MLTVFFIPDIWTSRFPYLHFLFTIVGIIGCIVPALPAWCSVTQGFCAPISPPIRICRHRPYGYGWPSPWPSVWADYFPACVDDPQIRRLAGGRHRGHGRRISPDFFIFPPIGIILGPFVGAVAGELLNDRGDFPKAILVGFGSFLSFIVGTGLKVVAAVGMLIHVTADTYPAHTGLVRNSILTLSIMKKLLLFAVVIAAMLAAACSNSKYKYETVKGDR